MARSCRSSKSPVFSSANTGANPQFRKRDTQRVYALKTLRKQHIISRSEVNHTLAERTVLAQINNPFIVPLKFSFQSPEKLYLVLAFVNGGELFHHLQREGKFDVGRARFYTAELLCALECLHGFNVIYRDLKPENILLDYTGHISLCDFGLCKLNMREDDRTNSMTPFFFLPLRWQFANVPSQPSVVLRSILPPSSCLDRDTPRLLIGGRSACSFMRC